MKLNRRNSERALTRIEVVIIIAVLAVLAAMLFSLLQKNRERTRRSVCIDNLKHDGLGFRQFVIDSDSRYPMAVSTNYGGSKDYVETGEVFRQFQALSNQLISPKFLLCPADKARSPAKDFSTLNNTNISYFIGLDADETSPSMLLAGDRNLTNGIPLPPNRIMELTSNSVVGWTAEMHNRQGNIALSDGSVQSWSDRRLREALVPTGVATNRLAMP
jgi:hypothetical protein